MDLLGLDLYLFCEADKSGNMIDLLSLIRTVKFLFLNKYVYLD